MDYDPNYDKSKTDPVLITIVASLSILIFIIFIFVYLKHNKIWKKEKILYAKQEKEFFEGFKKRGILHVQSG